MHVASVGITKTKNTKHLRIDVVYDKVNEIDEPMLKVVVMTARKQALLVNFVVNYIEANYTVHFAVN